MIAAALSLPCDLDCSRALPMANHNTQALRYNERAIAQANIFAKVWNTVAVIRLLLLNPEIHIHLYLVLGLA